MNYVKRYFVYFFMFSFFSLLPMILPVNLQITNLTMPKLKMDTLVEFSSPVHNKYSYMEYVHDVMAENIEKENIKFRQLCDKIDEHHLALDKNAWFRGVRGAYTSFFKSSYLTNDQIADEMEQIESYIIEDDKEPLLEKLEQNHFYVNSLFRTLIFNKIQEIKRVKGSIVDLLYQPVIQKGFRRMVQERALQKYFTDAKKS